MQKWRGAEGTDEGLKLQTRGGGGLDETENKRGIRTRGGERLWERNGWEKRPERRKRAVEKKEGRNEGRAGRITRSSPSERPRRPPQPEQDSPLRSPARTSTPWRPSATARVEGCSPSELYPRYLLALSRAQPLRAAQGLLPLLLDRQNPPRARVC
jgi:hypothetical protein